MMQIFQLIDTLSRYVPLKTPLTSDSTRVQIGWVFVALKGYKYHGVDFVHEAVEKGASCILIEGTTSLLPVEQEAGTYYYIHGQHKVPVIFEEDLSKDLGYFAYHWYARVADQLKIIAITGTNGKTSTVYFIRQLCQSMGVSCATLGTLGLYWDDGRIEKGHLTTPDVLSLHYILVRLQETGVKVLALEASSIGLEQGRLQGVPVRYAGFTNLTQDHLDYHQTMSAYAQAKSILFQMPSLEYACINQDDDFGMTLIKALREEILLDTLSLKKPAHCFVQIQEESFHGTRILWNHCSEWLPIHGAYNVYNLFLAVYLVSKSLGVAVETLKLSNIQSPKGRLERIVCSKERQEPLVFVDYAHTPDALKNVLQAIRSFMPKSAKLHCIFGCGGDRDQSKRALMGNVASEFADDVYLTSDNPRSEDPEAIIKEIELGLKYPANKVNIHRGEMILDVLMNVDSKDVVLIAGKGHETEQVMGHQLLFFDDAQWAYAGLFLRTYPTISRDTRTVQQGELLVALKGEHFDAHQYLHTLTVRPGLILLEERGTLPVSSSIPVLQVSNVLSVLQCMARIRRQSMSTCIIGIAGSNGKTSLKEMTASIFQHALGAEAVLKTQGNLNNHIGVPLTLLALKPQHQVAVIEMGMNHSGEMKVLSDMVRPDIAIVNNAQREHQEFMCSVEAVAKENGTVFEYLSSAGTAIFPMDFDYQSIWIEQSKGHMYKTFDIKNSQANVYAKNTCFNGLTGMDFEWVYQDKSYATHLPVLGEHHVHNALGAISIALVYGLSSASILKGLSNFSPVSGRMQLKPHQDTLWIDDTYNANPDSVRAAIDVLSVCPAPRCLILGDMGEVGEQGDVMHEEVGAYAKQKGIEYFIGVGELSTYAVKAFGDSSQSVQSVSSIDMQSLKSMRSVLVKGSRYMHMEAVFDRIKEI